MNTQSDNGNITVFGAKPAPNKTAETPELTKSETSSADSIHNKEKIQETDNIQVFGAKKQKQEPTPEEVNKDKVSENDSKETKPKENIKSDSDNRADEEEKQKAFNVDFKDEVKDQETPSSEENKQETVSLSEESVLQYLKTQFPDAYADVKDLSELSRKEQLPEPVDAFNKFHKETGRGLKDFYNFQRDWSKETPNETLREFYKLTSEGLSDEDIETQLELVVPSEDDELDLSPDEFKRKSIEFKKEHAKALKFMQNKSKEYAAPLDSVAAKSQAKPMTDEELAKSYQPYWTARDKSLDKYNEFKFSIGIGDVKVPITEEIKKMISDRSQTDQSIFAPWIKDGKVDAQSVVENIGWAIPEVRQQLLAESAKQINALTLEKFSKENRNVTLDKIPEKAKERKTGSVQTFGGSAETRMGTPLM